MRGVEGRERGGGGDVGARQEQARQGVAAAGEVHAHGHLARRGVAPQGRVGVGEVGAQAHHVRAEVAEREQVVRHRAQRLPGQAEHHPAADFVALRLHPPQLRQARVLAVARGAGMDAREEVAVGGLEAQQVAIGAGLAPSRGVGLGPFAQREGDALARLGLDAPHQPRHALPRPERGALAGLQHHRAEAQLPRQGRACHDFVVAHGVAVRRRVGMAHAAVETVAVTDAGELDQPTEEDAVALRFRADGPRLGEERLAVRRRQRLQDPRPVHGRSPHARSRNRPRRGAEGFSCPPMKTGEPLTNTVSTPVAKRCGRA